MIKTCKKCNIEKSLDNFNKKADCKLGLRPSCRECDRLYKKDYNSKNKEKNKQYALDNKEVIKEYKKQHAEKNKEAIRVYKREWEQNKRATDLQFKIAQNLRTRLREAIKNKAKSGSAVSDLGCSIDSLVDRMATFFDDNMTWENYGLSTWHIDHIVPLSHFDLENKEEFKIASHYLNLVPRSAFSNLSKGDKLPDNYLEIIESIKKVINGSSSV